MKAIIALLLPLSVAATTFEYKEVHRTYRNLDQLDLSECAKTFRFINGNWMDCRLHLPGLISSPAAQIENFNVDEREETIPLSRDMNFFLRITTTYRDADEGSASTHLLIQAYYQKPGAHEIHSASAAAYSFPVLKEKLLSILKNWRPSGKTVIAYAPNTTSKFFDDEIIGHVSVGKSTDTPDAERCLQNYEHDQVDNWPDDEVIWYSQCSYSDEPIRFSLFLENFWSPKLKNNPVTTSKLIELSGNMIARIEYSYSGFTIALGKITKGAADFNINLTPAEAAPLIHEATLRGSRMQSFFYALDSQLNRLRPNEVIIGKLILNRSHMKDEIDFE